MKKLTLLLALLFLLQPAMVFSNSDFYRVKLFLTAPDVFRSELVSNVNLELRRLGDVVLVDEDKETPDWIISIVAIESKLHNGPVTGIVASVVISTPFNNKQLIPLTKNELKPTTSLGIAIGVDLHNLAQSWIKDPIAYVQFITEDLGRGVDHRLLIDSRSNISAISRSIVADFEINHLEARRRIQRMMKNNLLRRIQP